MRTHVLATSLALACLCAAARAHDDHGDDGKLPENSAPAEIDGFGPFTASNRVQQLAQMTITQLGGIGSQLNNDIWGWTDPTTGHEYALVGRSNGTSFVDVTDPFNPVLVADLRSHNNTSSAWRDIKVYNNHAYIVAEISGHGVQIFDLTKLRTTTPGTVFSATTSSYADPNNPQPGDFLWRDTTVTTAHNIAINEQTGFAYVVGSSGNASNAGLHVLDLTVPYKPIVAGDFSGDGYTHDTQVVVYHGPDLDYQGKEIAFSSNADTLTITNVDTKSAMSMIVKRFYLPRGYTHQGWLTEDHRYFILGDESDETSTPGPTLTRTHIFNVEDLDNPVHLGYHEGVVATSDHNLYVHQGLIYEANYSSGLRILEPINLQNAQLNEIGFLDTYATDNNEGFNGAWSVYPFFASGTIIVNDRQNGLFIARLLKGDTDDDGDVDNSDLLTAGTNFTGPGGVGKHFATGSFDGDGDVDNSDLLTAGTYFTGPGGSQGLTAVSAGAGVARLLYDPDTGNLQIDTTTDMDGQMFGFVLNSNGQFLPPHTPVFDNFTYTSTSSELSETDFDDPVSGQFDLGNVLPIGLDEAGLQDLFTQQRYGAVLGQPERQFDLVVIPEPRSLALLAAGVLLMGWIFRGRWQRTARA